MALECTVIAIEKKKEKNKDESGYINTLTHIQRRFAVLLGNFFKELRICSFTYSRKSI